MTPPPVNRMILRFERLLGGVRITNPACPGWVAFAAGGHDMLRAVEAAWAEQAIAAYAASRGRTYDVQAHDAAADIAAGGRHGGHQIGYDPDIGATAVPPAPIPRLRIVDAIPIPDHMTGDRRLALRAARRWKWLRDGRAISPYGRTFPPDRMIAQRVRATLTEAGEWPPPTYED